VVRERHRLVGPRVEGADDDLAARERSEDLGVEVRLLLDARFRLRGEERQLRAEQTDALRLRLRRLAGRGPVLHVRQHLDVHAVLGLRGTAPHPDGLAPCGVLGHPLLRHRGVDSDLDEAPGAVHEDGGALLDPVEGRRGDDAGDAELPGDDRGVAGGPSEAGDEGDDRGGVQARGVRRSEVLSEEDGRRLGVRDARLGLAGEFRHHPVPDVAQVRGALRHQPAHLLEGLHELLRGPDGGDLRARPALHELRDGARPATVAGEGRRRPENLGGDAGGGARACRQPVGDGAGSGVEARDLVLAPILGTGAPPLGNVGRAVAQITGA
jgi:hypothetical protein